MPQVRNKDILQHITINAEMMANVRVSDIRRLQYYNETDNHAKFVESLLHIDIVESRCKIVDIIRKFSILLEIQKYIIFHTFNNNIHTMVRKILYRICIYVESSE